MNTVKIQKGNTRMIAHRGLSGLELGNTCPAFVAAGNRSYWGIETDVHKTADGKFVVIHDDTTSSVSAQKVSVEGSDFDTLRSIPLKQKDGATRIDLRIPSLEEYLDICRHYGKIAVLELKNALDYESVARIVDICREHYGLKNMVFISFHFQNMVHIKTAAPEANAQYLLEQRIDLLERTDLVEKMLALGVDVDIAHRALTQKHIEYLHEKGMKVNCWTVDDPQRAQELISWGVDYITSNILE